MNEAAVDAHPFRSALLTLSLGILGASVLPVPFAFSRSGIVIGFFLAFFVASTNALTCTILLRSAAKRGAHTYEALAAEVLGRPWGLLITRVSLILLLFGNLCGDFALLADMGDIAVRDLFPGHKPGSLQPRLILIILSASLVFPLSCTRHMRQLEKAAVLGLGLIIILALVIIFNAAQHGFPAIASGELPWFGPSASVVESLPEAVAVFSFAFYLHPMLLPLLHEMPSGPFGVTMTCRAAQIATVVVATGVYSIVGICAAARYGLKTEGDVMVNNWLPGRWNGALDAVMALYICISMAPMAMTLRFQLENLLYGEDYLSAQDDSYRSREIKITLVSLLASLGVALIWPTESELMFAWTGASACSMVCYIIPVWISVRLYYFKKEKSEVLLHNADDQEEDGEEEDGENDDDPYSWMKHVFVPLVIASLGVSFQLGGFMIALTKR